MPMIKRVVSPPVIIIGMHRSGTSLVSRLLEKMGFFWGSVKDDNNESLCFQVLNEQLFLQDNCRWDDVDRLSSFLGDEHRRWRAARIVESIVDERFIQLFWGDSGMEQEVSLVPAVQGWGFKDPRNTFTLPIFLELFPGARVVHVIRNGIDVAVSLWKRETTRPEGSLHPHYSPLCQELEGCLMLWKCYVKRAMAYAKNDVDIHELFYEDLLGNPQDSIVCLAEYLGVSATAGLNAAPAMINRGRRYNYRNAPVFFDFAQKAKMEPLMTQLYEGKMTDLY
ncbi:MAG: sulfotransferase [Proteobacteria bacterium]|nr:sulfotransferase [Pseudomonadota bacterium]